MEAAVPGDEGRHPKAELKVGADRDGETQKRGASAAGEQRHQRIGPDLDEQRGGDRHGQPLLRDKRDHREVAEPVRRVLRQHELRV
jgi:hypothetical protein